MCYGVRQYSTYISVFHASFCSDTMGKFGSTNVWQKWKEEDFGKSLVNEYIGQPNV